MAIESSEESRLLTVREVAERLRVHPITVRRHIKGGRLRAVRVGQSVRVRPSDVEAFLRGETAPAASLADRRWPTPAELQRRAELMVEAFERRDSRSPLGISTAELVREARASRDWTYEDEE